MPLSSKDMRSLRLFQKWQRILKQHNSASNTELIEPTTIYIHA